MLQLFQQDFTSGLIALAVIIVSLALHELGHAYAADLSGDPTPRLQGRLSFNPLVHIDPFGLALIVLVGFGFARPVMTRPMYFKYRWSELLVSSAGILVNLLIAVLCAFWLSQAETGTLIRILSLTLYLNCALMVLNALPIPPLDGSHILAALLPRAQLMLGNGFTWAVIVPLQFSWSWYLSCAASFSSEDSGNQAPQTRARQTKLERHSATNCFV